MPMPAQTPTTTPIPVQLSESEFNQLILPHLSMPRRGPKCKLGYHRLFSLILWVLYTSMQWKCLPMPEDGDGKAKIHLTGLSLHHSYINLDGGFDSKSNRKVIFNAGMIPNIKENPRNRKTVKRGRKRLFDQAIHT